MNPPANLQSILPKSEDFYSCHDFSAWMHGNSKVTRPDLEKIIERGIQVEGGLPVGAQGVIGHMVRNEPPLIQHSLIGLGEDNPLGLQVMWNVGHMGIVSNDTQTRFYYRNSGGTAYRKTHGVTGNGLYIERSSSPAL